MSSLKTGVLAEPLLVGREKELEELRAFLNSVVEGKGKTVFVLGEAGSGKTRLTREFLNAAIKQGVAVMAGWCLSDSQAPFFPFIEAFNSYYSANTEAEQSISFQQSQLNLDVPAQIGLEEREITSWLAGPKPTMKTGRAEMLSPQVWKDQALAAVANTVHTIALQAPVILFIEDLHWADSASLALLHYLARAIQGSERVLLLATFRSEELTADAEGHPHPLAETLRMMRREELFSEVKLRSLDQADVSKLAESMVGSCVQQEFTKKLTVQSGGSPLFIVESLRLLNEHGGLIKEGACVRLDIDKITIPSKVKDIILRRLGSLRRDQRRVLDAASVIGETFDLELLGSVLGQDSLLVVETLGAIAQSTSLLVSEGDCFRFDHAKSREALYEEIPLPIKKGYHERIAEKLEASAKLGALLLSDIAYHYTQAGNREKAVKYSLAAGQDALAKFSNAQAIRHFQYALQNVSDEGSEAKKTALEGLGDAYAANDIFADAIRTFEELASLETGPTKLRAIRKAMDAAYTCGDKPDLLMKYAKQAQELGVDDRLEMARIIDNRGKAWGWSGRGTTQQDLADYEAALQVFEEENSLGDVAEALWRSGCLGSDVKLGFARLMRSVAIFRELGNIRQEVQTIFWLANRFRNFLLIPESKQEYRKILDVGERLGVFVDLALTSCFLGWFEEDEGNIAEALAKYSKALEYSYKTDAKWVQGLACLSLMKLYSSLGDLKQADEYFDRISKLPPEIFSALAIRWWSPVCCGVYFAARAKWEESNQAFAKILEFMKTFTWPHLEKLVGLNYAWALERQGRFEEARTWRNRIQALLGVIEHEYARADMRLSVLMPRKVLVGEVFEMRLDVVNVARRAAEHVKIEGIIPSEFNVVGFPSWCGMMEGGLYIKDKSIAPFQVETIKLKMRATKAGAFPLNPAVSYLDDLGNKRAFKADSVTLTVSPTKPVYVALPGRVATGTMELDKLLLGGIPEKYAVVLTASSTDERQQLINRFVEAGPEKGESTVYVTCEASRAEELARNFQTNFHVCVCNPQADSAVTSLPNIIKLKGTENLTDIDIALAKLFRALNVSQAVPKRFCVDLLSDVLLQHHAVTTRRWLSGLLASLKSKGFATLAVIDPSIASEEVSAISSLFDGEIRLAEKETPSGAVKTLKILKLQGQSYLKDEVILD